MPSFSNRSLANLNTCHDDLINLFLEVVKHHDCTVLEGFRDEETQNKYFNENRTTLLWPYSKHNKSPSLAVDVIPYPVDWDDAPKFYRFSGFVFGMATARGIQLRWGGDWDRDWDLKDNRFNDFPHYELNN